MIAQLVIQKVENVDGALLTHSTKPNGAAAASAALASNKRLHFLYLRNG